MEVATPWISSAPRPTFGFSPSPSLYRMPSISIFPPMNSSRISAIQGIHFSKDWKYWTIVWTQTQPIIGIRAWKNANVPAMMQIFRLRIPGSFSPLASDTEKASIARPTPSRALFRKNIRFHSISGYPICSVSPQPDFSGPCAPDIYLARNSALISRSSFFPSI